MNSVYKEYYKILNPAQKSAVDKIEGPVLVIAGPGTGKTQVLTMRIANILTQTDTTPSSVLALTFTDSGVRAMKQRLVETIGTTAYYVNIHTFHSFASDVIKSNNEEFIFSTQLEALSDLERIYIFKQIIDESKFKVLKPFNSPYFYIQTIISKIKDLKREGISPTEYQSLIQNKDSMLDEKDHSKNIELQNIYQEYQEKLIEHGRYDFEDMINYVLEKFKSSPTLLSYYQEKYQYFLVDEFQDTNSSQAELLYTLNSYWKDNPNLFVVGDDDQSIYRFQGASVENIINFNNKFPNSEKIVLDINYRSNQSIINSAQHLISNNKNRISNKIDIDKSQKAHKKDDSKEIINYAEFTSSYTENIFIAQKINELVELGVEPSEIAVIYRNNSDSQDIADILARLKINYVLESGDNILETGIIVRLLHFLRVIDKIERKEEDLDLFTLLNYEFLDFNKLDVLKLSRFASTHKINFFEAIDHKDIDSAKISHVQPLLDFKNKLVTWKALSANITFIEFLETVIDDSNFLNWILLQNNSYELLNKINSFLSEVKRLNKSYKNLTLSQFLEYIELMIQNKIFVGEKSLEVNTNAVRLMTAHKSKGLEFDYVFIPKFIDKKWGNKSNKELIKLPTNILKTQKTDNDIEDERRLFFVAMTRAKKGVYITSAQTYLNGNLDATAIPSLFLYEIPKEIINKISIDPYEKNASALLHNLIKPVLPDYKNVTSEEEAFLKDVIKDFKLSATSLNTYLECAYKFKLDILFKTPEVRAKPLVMGTAVHKALELSYKELIDKSSVTEDFLLNSYEQALKQEILNDNEFEDILNEGKQILKIYYEKYRPEFNSNPSDTYYLEKFLGWGFSKPLLDNQIHLQGKIDKIRVINPREKLLKITDYKTGRPKSRNEIIGETKYSKGEQYRQLLFYKLLVDLDRSFDYRVDEVELDYIGDRKSKPKRESFKINDEDIEVLKNNIRDVYKNIKELNFERTTDYSVCSNCRFKSHCWPDGLPNQNYQLSLLVDNE